MTDEIIKKDYMQYLVLILVVLFVVTQYQIYSLKNSGMASSEGGSVEDLTKALPTGTPKIYGPELKVSFDRVEQSLSVLAGLETQINYMELGSAEQTRFTKIARTPGTSCEFCCGMGNNGFGFQSGIKSDCGCSHNYAFSGLTKYLLKNHASEFTDQDILEELHKWKMLFFPQQMLARYAEEKGLSVGQLPSMVGGC